MTNRAKTYDKAIEHAISVTIIKSTGNYTYFFSNNPGDEERIYNGITKYIDQVKGLVNIT